MPVAMLLSFTATHACAQSENDYGLIFGAVFGGALLLFFGGLIWFVRFLLRGGNSRENERFRSAGSAAEPEHRLGE